jgi:hypothetical protein
MTKLKTVVAELPATPQPGDVVGLKRLPALPPVGYVFDTMGELARVWSPAGAGVDSAEELTPFQLDELEIYYRPEAYLAVRFCGTPETPPYAFVSTGTYADVLITEIAFVNSPDYVIVSKRLKHETPIEEDTDHDEAEEDAGSRGDGGVG